MRARVIGLTTTFAAGLALTAPAALAAPARRAPIVRPTTDQQIALRARLRLIDFPAGWSGHPTPRDGPNCVDGLQRATTAFRTSASFEAPAFGVNSTAYIFRDVATATHWFKVLSGRSTLRCVAAVLTRGPDLARISTLPISPVGDQRAATRFTVANRSDSSLGHTQNPDDILDFELVRVGRAVELLQFAGHARPLSRRLEARLTARATARLTGALIAGQAVLRLSDFPASFTPKPRTPGPGGAPVSTSLGCGLNGLVRTADASVFSDFTAAPFGGFSFVYVYADAAAATRFFEKLSGSATRRCIVSGLRGPQNHRTTVTVQPLTIAPLGDQRSAIRITVRGTTKYDDGDVDLEFVRVGRAVELIRLQTASVTTPFPADVEALLTKRVTDRLARGLTDTP